MKILQGDKVLFYYNVLIKFGKGVAGPCIVKRNELLVPSCTSMSRNSNNMNLQLHLKVSIKMICKITFGFTKIYTIKSTIILV